MEVVAGRDDQPLALGERERTGEEGRRVPVWPEAEVNEVEGPVVAEEPVVGVDGFADRVARVPHRVDRPRKDLVDERVPRHALVRLGVAGRHPPLVAEEHVDLAPNDVGASSTTSAEKARGTCSTTRTSPRRLKVSATYRRSSGRAGRQLPSVPSCRPGKRTEGRCRRRTRR